ncbi:helix-turn-helix domain-containing protein [Pseudoxanthobacter sp. M-2]|uniref:helix-turn-helix domain-containing protein n=1 Tax=Pseudoxanthobacter sp. M-2 TaxID=3078754 RepID=UPI0038FC6373
MITPSQTDLTQFIAKREDERRKIIMNPTFVERLNSIAEVKGRAGICRTMVYNEIAKGRLVTRKIGSRTFVAESDLLAYLRSLASA